MNSSFTSPNPAQDQASRSIPRRGGGQLLRRTFLIALILVSGGLITSNGLETMPSLQPVLVKPFSVRCTSFGNPSRI